MKKMIKNLIILVVMVTAVSLAARSQTAKTENTLKLAGQVGEKASLSDMAWLAGDWLGTGLDGVSEESWRKPMGGTMIGTFRLIKDGKPIFYEMMMLAETEGSLVLRIKHFDPNFVAWEEKEKTVDFKFVKASGMRMYFSDLTFERIGNNDLKIYLALKQKDGSIREEIFTMKRSK